MAECLRGEKALNSLLASIGIKQHSGFGTVFRGTE
jgi:hypothetical protein